MSSTVKNRNDEVGQLMQGIQRNNYSIVKAFAELENRCWTCVEIPDPTGGRGHDELRAPDFVSLGMAKWGSLEWFRVIPDETKNLSNYKLYKHLLHDKVIDRMGGLPDSLLSGHTCYTEEGRQILRNAGVFHIESRFQLLPEHSDDEKDEAAESLLRQLSNALLFYYGETMECLSSNVTLRLLSRYRAELISEGRLLQEVDFKTHDTSPLIDGLRPLDYIDRIKCSDDSIRISIPRRWTIEYPKKMRSPKAIARSSPIHFILEWN